MMGYRRLDNFGRLWGNKSGDLKRTKSGDLKRNIQDVYEVTRPCDACGLADTNKLYVGDYMSLNLCDYCAVILVQAITIRRLEGDI